MQFFFRPFNAVNLVLKDNSKALFFRKTTLELTQIYQLEYILAPLSKKKVVS